MHYLFQIFGEVQAPPGVSSYGNFGAQGGPTKFITNIIRLLIVGASIYALVNFVLAGYAYMSAGGDAKKIADATAKITQTMIGLALAAGSFIVAALLGRILFGDYNALMQITVFGPT